MPKHDDNHPWKARTRGQISERAGRTRHAGHKKTLAADLRDRIVQRGWVCPSCGRVDCDFGECTDANNSKF